MTSKLRRETKRELAGRDRELNSLRRALDKSKLQLQRVREEQVKRESVLKVK